MTNNSINKIKQQILINHKNILQCYTALDDLDLDEYGMTYYDIEDYILYDLDTLKNNRRMLIDTYFDILRAQ